MGIPETAIAHGKLAALRAGLVRAARDHVSVIAATGDSGPPGPAWAAARSPGPPPTRWSPPSAEPSCRPARPGGGCARTRGLRLYATGAGLSALFPRPAYQDQVSGVVGDHRGVADVSMDCAMWVRTDPTRPERHGVVLGVRDQPGRPHVAGIAALAGQAAGHPLGPLNPLLYRLHGTSDGVLDITAGNNTDAGVRGYSAGRGYDLPSGTGTVGSAPAFTTALARLAHHQ